MFAFRFIQEVAKDGFDYLRQVYYRVKFANPDLQFEILDDEQVKTPVLFVKTNKNGERTFYLEDETSVRNYYLLHPELLRK